MDAEQAPRTAESKYNALLAKWRTYNKRKYQRRVADPERKQKMLEQHRKDQKAYRDRQRAKKAATKPLNIILEDDEAPTN